MALQRKLLRFGKLALVVSVVPWILMGTGMVLSLNQQEPTECLAHPIDIRAPIPFSQATTPEPEQGMRAGASDREAPSNPNGWAIRRTNNSLLGAYQDREVKVQHVKLTREEVERMPGPDMRTRTLPVELEDGRRGIKLLRTSPWFERHGLHKGDVLVGVNGRDLTDPRVALEVYAEAAEARHAVLELVREGKPVVMLATWNE